VVVVTATSENKIAAECIAEGAFGYVPKPFNLTYMDHMAAVAIAQAGQRKR
jgi:DNA-binding NtrC family response regulator